MIGLNKQTIIYYKQFNQCKKIMKFFFLMNAMITEDTGTEAVTV